MRFFQKALDKNPEKNPWNWKIWEIPKNLKNEKNVKKRKILKNEQKMSQLLENPKKAYYHSKSQKLKSANLESGIVLDFSFVIFFWKIPWFWIWDLGFQKNPIPTLLLMVQARIISTQSIFTTEKVTIDGGGFVCKNSDQADNTCSDYEMRMCCPAMGKQNYYYIIILFIL